MVKRILLVLATLYFSALGSLSLAEDYATYLDSTSAEAGKEGSGSVVFNGFAAGSTIYLTNIGANSVDVDLSVYTFAPPGKKLLSESLETFYPDSPTHGIIRIRGNYTNYRDTGIPESASFTIKPLEQVAISLSSTVFGGATGVINWHSHSSTLHKTLIGSWITVNSDGNGYFNDINGGQPF